MKRGKTSKFMGKKKTLTKAEYDAQRVHQKQRREALALIEKWKFLDRSFCDDQWTPSLAALRSLSFRKGGFLDDSLRKEIWCSLLGLGRKVSHEGNRVTDWNMPHPSDEQVQRDVERSLAHHDCFSSLSNRARDQEQKKLFKLINAVLNHDDSKHVHYYQGYHDVCSVVMEVMQDDPRILLVVQRLTLKYFSLPMEKEFHSAMTFNRSLFPLLRLCDPELFEFLEKSEVEPYFAFPWIITWFSHQLYEMEAIKRLFDVLLSTPSRFIIYVAAALVLQNKSRIMKVECELSQVHHALSSLPKTMDMEVTIDILANIRPNRF